MLTSNKKQVVNNTFSEDTNVPTCTFSNFCQSKNVFILLLEVCNSRQLSVEGANEHVGIICITLPETRKRKCDKNDGALSCQLHLFTSDFIFTYC